MNWKHAIIWAAVVWLIWRLLDKLFPKFLK